MTTEEIQLAFWTDLRKSNQELFNGNPSSTQYFDIPINDEFIIRLDIYLNPKNYRKKGTQTIALIINGKKNDSIKSNFSGNKDYIILHDNGILFQASNGIAHSPITEDPNSWDSYKKWFTKYAQKLKQLLNSWD